MRFTLWAEGPSDACLIPILEWLLRQNGVIDDIEAEEALIFRSKKRYKTVSQIFEDEDYWSDLLFMHTDADSHLEELGKGPVQRGKACEEKAEEAKRIPPHVCVIPVQETETWLLVSKEALKKMGSKQNSQIGFPGRPKLEGIRNPKKRLCTILRNLEAETELSEDEADTKLWKEIALSIRDEEPKGYEILRGIPSFDRLEATVQTVVERNGLAGR